MGYGKKSRKPSVYPRRGDYQRVELARRHKCGSKTATYNYSHGTNVPQTVICDGCGEDLR